MRYHDSTPEASRQLVVFLSSTPQNVDEYSQRDRKGEDGQPGKRQQPPITCALERFCVFGYGDHIRRLAAWIDPNASGLRGERDLFRLEVGQDRRYEAQRADVRLPGPERDLSHSPVAAHRQGRIEQRGCKINPPAVVIRPVRGSSPRQGAFAILIFTQLLCWKKVILYYKIEDSVTIINLLT